MAIPSQNHPCWQKLASGGFSKLKTNQLGIQLMGKRLDRSTDSVATKSAEIYAYFVKWERTLEAEIQQLSTL
ncbi:MAG: hypothetical protein K2Q11_04465 [Burkholderiaceae bacterium]|nr:hypothetical protein [Burkholderiaceae bacterium]